MQGVPAAKSDYRLQGKLAGHTGAILALKARDDGKFLASGGSDASGPKIWDLQGLCEVEVVTVASDMRGATTKLQWIKREDDVGEALIYGTQNGYIVCCRLENVEGKAVRFKEIWNRQMSDPAELTGLAFDPSTNRLAACHRGGVLQMFTLNATMAEKEVVSHRIRHCVPQAVAFGAMHGDERELLIFGLHCGLVYNVRGTSICAADDAWSLGCRISDVAVDVANGVLCVSDPSAGVHLYRLTGGELVKSFHVPVKKSRRIRQVGLLDANHAVVSGSDHGVLYAYTRRNNLLTKLQVDPNKWVQTVATADIAGVPTIFVAKSREISGKNDIFIYGKRLVTPEFIVRLAAGLKLIGWLFIVLAAIAFGYEKVFGELTFKKLWEGRS